jgi:hypothetical protein
VDLRAKPHAAFQKLAGGLKLTDSHEGEPAAAQATLIAHLTPVAAKLISRIQAHGK